MAYAASLYPIFPDRPDDAPAPPFLTVPDKTVPDKAPRTPALPGLARRGRAAISALTPLFRHMVQNTPPDTNLLRIWRDALLPHALRLPESQRALFGHALAFFCAELLELMARLYVTAPETPPAGNALLRSARQAARMRHVDAVCAIPGTWKGELSRVMALIARLPAALPVREAAETAPDPVGDTSAPAPQLQSAATSLAYGYLHLLAAALATGRPVPDPERHDIWLTAALHSGAAAMLGAALDSAVQRNGLHTGHRIIRDALHVQLHACLHPAHHAKQIQPAPACTDQTHPGGIR